MKLAALSDEQIYYLALGKFISQFSKVEHMVFFYLADLLKITKDECNAVTSGTKIDGCINYIKRVHEARGAKVPADILECFDRLGPINTLRNNLVHWYTDKNLTVTNEGRQFADRVRSYKVNPEMLEDAEFDLVKALIILNSVINTSESDQEFLARVEQMRNAPWRYKPPLQENSYPGSPTKPQGQ